MPGTVNLGFVSILVLGVYFGFYPDLKIKINKQTKKKPKYFLALTPTFLVALKSYPLLLKAMLFLHFMFVSSEIA